MLIDTIFPQRRYFPSLTVHACDEAFTKRGKENRTDGSLGGFEMLPTRADSPDLETGER